MSFFSKFGAMKNEEEAKVTKSQEVDLIIEEIELSDNDAGIIDVQYDSNNEKEIDNKEPKETTTASDEEYDVDSVYVSTDLPIQDASIDEEKQISFSPFEIFEQQKDEQKEEKSQFNASPKSGDFVDNEQSQKVAEVVSGEAGELSSPNPPNENLNVSTTSFEEEEVELDEYIKALQGDNNGNNENVEREAPTTSPLSSSSSSYVNAQEETSKDAEDISPDTALFDDNPPFISEIQITESTEIDEIEHEEFIYSKSSPGRSVYKSGLPNYCPIAEWTGRLIFNCEQRNPGLDDGVSIEIEHAPLDYQHLIGETVPLRWNLDNEVIREFVRVTTRDVKLTDKGRRNLESNEYLKPPSRLHYRFGVGPLESLAGSRRENSIHVMLPSTGVTVKPISLPSSFRFVGEEKKGDFRDLEDSSPTTIYLDDHPVQITGVYYCVVMIIERVENDLFKVKHFNTRSKKFDGIMDIIRIPQAKDLRFSKKDRAFPSSISNIEKSPENRFGWYLYGSFISESTQDRFVVEALEPLRALILKPGQFIDGRSGWCKPILSKYEAINFINNGNFNKLKQRTGKCHTTLVDLHSKTKNDAVASWEEGDLLLVVQCTGGMKSDTYNHDRQAGMIVAGHFSYGYATVVHDPLIDQLRFDIEYIQVHGTNAVGLISGAIKRQCFLGCLDDGYIGIRPVSDALVKIDALSNEYKIGPDYTCRPLDYLKHQLHIMAARYRVGDGLGVVNVNRKTNCTHDSNQALYVAMKQAEDFMHQKYKEVKLHCESSWDFSTVVMDEKNTQLFAKLTPLCTDIRSILAPFGIIDSDWRQNANSFVLAENMLLEERRNPTPCKSLVAHQTLFPRRAFDEIAKVLCRNDAKLWFVTTVIVGGENKVVPMKPVEPSAFAKTFVSLIRFNPFCCGIRS